MKQPILTAEHICKTFYQPQAFRVLNDISLTVTSGEFVSIMGKSGCGKSTLLYVLSTLDTAYEGSLNIDGTMLNGLSESMLARFRNQKLGFVFQHHYLLPEFTVLENVMMPARKLGKKTVIEIERDAMQLLNTFDVARDSDKLASKLSGGQQQRVAIARALINRPQLIMADEPTGNLDSVNSSVVLHIFRELSQQGHTIIAVTHDKDFASKSHRIIHMKDGAISADPADKP